MDGTHAVPADGAHRVPAEWEPHEATLVCWPERDEIWGDNRERALDEYTAVIAAVSRFEPVVVIAAPRRAAEAQRRCDPLAGTGVDIEVVEIPIDDSWARDSGPIQALAPDGSRVVVGVEFNAWGHAFSPFDDDALLARRWAERTGTPWVPVVTTGMDGSATPFVLEGGSVSVDGCGTVITTGQCLLHPNRNPRLSRSAIEDALHRALGTTTVVWLPAGLTGDADTDGHVDNVATFVRPGTVLVQGCDDVDEPDHDVLVVNARCVRDALDATGRRIDVVEVPLLPFDRIGDDRVVVPYLNLYLCNGGAVVPVTGHPADDEMLDLISGQLPGREVVAVPATALASGGGGPHCITQQIPRSSSGSTTDTADRGPVPEDGVRP